MSIDTVAFANTVVYFLVRRRPPQYTLFPYTTLSDLADLTAALHGADTVEQPRSSSFSRDVFGGGATPLDLDVGKDRKSTRLNSSHGYISYAVFCLKKKKINISE